MTVRSASHPGIHVPVLPQVPLTIAGRIAIASLVLLGLGALAGGAMLVSRPDGSAMGFNVALLAGSPFADYLIPGLILGGLFGVGSLVTAFLGLRHSGWAPLFGIAIGTGQMIWILVELAIIREFSFLHPTMFAIGLVIAATSILWARPIIQTWRTTSLTTTR